MKKIFDILTYTKKLKEAGVPEKEAEVHAEALKKLEEKLVSNINHMQQLPSDEDEYCDISGVKLDSKLTREPHKCLVCNGRGKIQIKDTQ
jgi:hypothetical protein